MWKFFSRLWKKKKKIQTKKNKQKCKHTNKFKTQTIPTIQSLNNSNKHIYNTNLACDMTRDFSRRYSERCAPAMRPLWVKCSSRYFPNREELLLMTVRALPKDSIKGFSCEEKIKELQTTEKLLWDQLGSCLILVSHGRM